MSLDIFAANTLYTVKVTLIAYSVCLCGSDGGGCGQALRMSGARENSSTASRHCESAHPTVRRVERGRGVREARVSGGGAGEGGGYAGHCDAWSAWGRGGG